MELAPAYKAQRHRQILHDSIMLAMNSDDTRSAALLLDTAIESARTAARADREAQTARDTRRN